MSQKKCFHLLLLTILVSTASLLQAAENEDLSHGAERVIGGHSFLPSRYISDPFVETYYESHVGGASAPTFERDFHDIDGNTLFTVKGNLVFATLGMKYQQHLGQNWAVGLGGSGLIRAGTTAVSFIEDGARVNTDGGLWVKRQLKRDENSQLTVGLNWGYVSTTLFTPGEFAEHIADGGALEDAPLVQNGKNWSSQLDLAWAHAFNPSYAVRLHGAVGVVEKQDNGSVLVGHNSVGFLLEGDFNDKHGLPLGITLGHFINIPSDHVESGPSGTVLGFWYTGAQEFVIGLETGWLQIPTDDKGASVDGAFGVIDIKYYF